MTTQTHERPQLSDVTLDDLAASNYAFGELRNLIVEINSDVFVVRARSVLGAIDAALTAHLENVGPAFREDIHILVRQADDRVLEEVA